MTRLRIHSFQALFVSAAITLVACAQSPANDGGQTPDLLT